MKIAVIGGGSTYTPELVNGFLERVASLPVSELWLMDIDQERLSIVGGFALRMVQARGDPFKVVVTTDQQAAIQGASYVITQLRVGQMPARVADEYLGQRHGLIGQETTGVGGMVRWTGLLSWPPVNPMLNPSGLVRRVRPRSTAYSTMKIGICTNKGRQPPRGLMLFSL